MIFKIFKIFLASVAIFIVAILFWLTLLDGHYSVSHSITIHAPKDSIAKIVNNLQKWEEWSPWMNTGVEVKGQVTQRDGREQIVWQHVLTGNTRMTNLTDSIIQEARVVSQQIEFERPFMSYPLMTWKLTDTGNSEVKVDYSLSGEVPFIYRFVVPRLTTILSMELDRSLSLLKDYVETGQVHATISIEGITTQEDIEFIGINNSSVSHSVDSVMQETFMELNKTLEIKNIPAGNTLSCYYDFGINADKRCEFTCAVMTNDSVKDSLPPPLVRGKIKGSKTLKIKFKGDYKHLTNAWATGLIYIRAKGLKPKKRIPPYEIYIQTEANSMMPGQWETELYIPVR